MNTELDTYNQIEYARESGHEEGLKEGHKKGREEERLKIAMNLIRIGASCEIISQTTGLSAEEISKLKEELRN